MAKAVKGDEEALLAAVWAHPLDDAPRLVYADWLDERGRHDRAEFIRAQCEAELLPPADPRHAELEARANQLLKVHKREWLKPMKGRVIGAQFWRGFPLGNLAHLTLDQLEDLSERDLRGAPLWRYHYGMTGRDLLRLLRWPLLHKLCTFSLRRTGLRPGWAERVAGCEGLRNVTELAFIGLDMTTGNLKTVLDAWTGRRLLRLWVNECPVGDAGIRLIARHPACANLRLLRAHTAEITSRGMKAVADGPNLDGLVQGTFAHNALGAAGGRHLLRWKALDGIRELYLMNTGLPQAAQAKLCERLGTRVLRL